MSYNQATYFGSPKVDKIQLNQESMMIGNKRTKREGPNQAQLFFGQCIITLDIPSVEECVRTGSGMNESGEIRLERRNQR